MKPIVILLLSAIIVIACNNNHHSEINTNPAPSPLVFDKTLLDTQRIAQMEDAISGNEYPNIHSVLIHYQNKPVYENYWKGQDETWGDDAGVRVHGRDSLHDMRSITKSVVSACVGIAIQQGKIKGIDQRVFDFFPEYKSQDTGMKSLLTIRHLLIMTSGLKWNEDVPYNNPENSEIAMIQSKDPMGYVLSQPMEKAAGQEWKYNGGTTQLLAAIIQKTTGKRIDSFANEYLFQPIGISTYEWIKYPGTELPAAASGLRLRSADLMKFGLLYLNEGRANNQQLLSAEWVRQSMTSQVKRGDDGDYGFQFWLWTVNMQNKAVNIAAGVGNGDQRVFIDKQDSLVVVITAGNYNRWDIEKGSMRLFKDFIYPAIFSHR